MNLNDLECLTGTEFHDRHDRHHVCKDDAPIYFLIDRDNWLTICQSDEDGDDLWRGEWETYGGEFFTAYDGYETPDECLAALQLMAQGLVAGAILEAVNG